MTLLGKLMLLVGLATVLGVSASAQPAISKVDPFIGVYGGGNLHPAATLPYSMVSLGPDVEYVQSPSGYGYTPDRKVIGFSHARTSGTGGGGRYGNFLVMPQVGAVTIRNKAATVKNEFASPGYYTCNLADSNINVALTLSEHVGFHEYTFGSGDTATVLVDVSATRLTREKSRCTEAHVEISGNRVLTGYAKYEGGWGGKNPYTAYFYAEFEQVAGQAGTWSQDVISPGKLAAASVAKSDLSLGALFKFPLSPKHRQVRLKLAMSYTSIASARAYFQQEPGWKFAALKKAGEAKWTRFLDRIKVAGGTPEEQKLFYTSFYRTAMIPRDLTGDNPLWQSPEPHFWDFYTFWDTYRTVNPLLTVIDPAKASALVRCLLDVYQHRGWLPEAWTGGDYGSVQGGSNPDVVVAEAMVKGIKGFDYELAYRALLKDAELQAPDPRVAGRYVNTYARYGYLPTENVTGPNEPPTGTSRSLEYSYNDYCIALAAKKLGKEADYQKYLKRSAAVFDRLYCDSLQVFWARNAAGRWLPGYDKGYSNGKSVNGVWQGWFGPYYEGSPLSYSCSAVQDVARLIRLHGGRDGFSAFLDDIFDHGHFEPDNEPGMHLPYLYVYAGDPHKTYERLKTVFEHSYHATRAGWPGNDDAGTTSAWYMWGHMGLYPMAGQDIYLLTTPTFSSIELAVGPKQHFLIQAKGLTAANTYIQSATLNGQPWNQAWLRHKDLVNGGTMVFTMGPAPSDWGKSNLPPSFDQVLAGQ